MIEVIDVSSNQDPMKIDRSRVFAAGITRVYARASDGVDWEDPKFCEHMVWARKNGDGDRGAYHFLRVRHGRVQDAEEQARQFLAKYRREGCTALAAVDCERVPMHNPSADEHNASTQDERRTAIRDWLRVVTGELGAGLVYGSADYLTPIGLTDEDLFGAGLWAADYGVETPLLASPWGDWIGWQWTGSGHIDGYDGGVDLSHFRVERLLPLLQGARNAAVQVDLPR